MLDPYVYLEVIHIGLDPDQLASVCPQRT